MVTIIGAHFFTGEKLQWLDFISIITVGVLGFMSVYFSLRYGQQLEEQRRELLALNTIAEAVNHSVELDYVLQSALQKVCELLGGEFGWIYLVENQTLVLKHRRGTKLEFFTGSVTLNDDSAEWLQEATFRNFVDRWSDEVIEAKLEAEGLLAWASIPLERKGTFAGVLILGTRSSEPFSKKQLNLLQNFGNQVGIALQNAYLFEQVRQSEQRYADLYEHSPDIYHSVNRDGAVVSCNVTECEVLGYTKEEVIGKPLIKLYPPELSEDVRMDLRRMFENGEELRGVEGRMRKKDGTLIDVSINVSLVHNAEDRPVLARIVARDITEKKKMEQQILHAQKIDSIGNLAGGIAHDFNNILASILGAASMMKRKMKETDRWYPHVDLMETASRRGAALTRQLLTFARKSSVHVRPLDLNNVVRETLRLVEASIPKSIQVRAELSSDLMVFSGDEGQIQQALLNLCINARDAMPEGGTLHVSTGAATLSALDAAKIAQAQPGGYVMLSVMDNGVGIPEELRSRIFEPFFTTKQQGKGTGLGLSVVYGVVRSHGGFTSLESAVGVGTKFTIYLTRIPETDMLSRPHRQKEVRGGNERILLVEDEVAVNRIVADMLKDLGYEVFSASEGHQAVEAIKSNGKPFSLVVLDMNMPRLGGKETFRRIKEIAPGLKILIASGYSNGMLDDGDFMSRIDGFIQKPFTVEEIAHKVREVLDEPKGGVSS
jgi:PAS domain S-box-containing protein